MKRPNIGDTVTLDDGRTGLCVELAKDTAQIALTALRPPEKKPGVSVFVTEASGMTQSRVWIYTSFEEVPCDPAA